MATESWQQVKELFELALEREASQRTAFLEEACADDRTLREEVEALLASHERAPNFLEAPPSELAALAPTVESAEPLVGRRIGPYQIVRELGHGGMGAVYLAQRVDEQYEKLVAIKVVKRGMDSEAILRRFRTERQILAQLDHPNITKLIDAGTTDDGRSYFIMDYVDGLPIDKYCDSRRLPIAERLTCFRSVCSAVEYAHAHSVVHRDIKPRNVLVTADGVPKLLDFGIAKLLQPQDSSQTADATASALRPMTLEYASPEQVRGEPVTPSSDVYALGVLLYELLTGRRPYRLEHRTPADVERTICEELPEKPSAVINRVEGVHGPEGEASSMTDAQFGTGAEARADTASVSAARGSCPETLRRQLAGDLDTIVMMALRKEPERRYASVKQFSEDIRRHLEGLPVIAQHDTLGYRSGKFIRRNRAFVMTSAFTALILLALISVARLLSSSRHQATGQTRQSLVVLPLENLSGDKEQDYFADGMTEALINDLAQISALRVISRTSAMHFKGVHKPLPEIARLLNVDAVVEGSVLRSGDRVRITAQLIQAATDRHLWAKTYERDERDILALQSDVASAIAQEVRIKLSPEEKGRLANRRPVDPEAHEAYLRGVYFWNKRTPEALSKAMELFQRAIDKDPSYALAYSGLAGIYGLRQLVNDVPPKEAIAKLRPVALKALEIDGTLAEAHTSLAGIMASYDFDWTGAEREHKRALELNPSYAFGHQLYSGYLSMMGRHEEAAREAKRAQELDPLSLSINATFGRVFYLARQYELAIAQCQKTLEMDPSFFIAQFFLAKAYTQKGMYEEALAVLHQVKGLYAEPRALIAFTYAVSGQRGPATRVLTELLEASKRQYVPRYLIAIIYTGLGDKNQALDWLEKAYQEREQRLQWLKVEPMLDSLRSEPRFQDLMRRVGLPP